MGDEFRDSPEKVLTDHDWKKEPMPTRRKEKEDPGSVGSGGISL